MLTSQCLRVWETRMIQLHKWMPLNLNLGKKMFILQQEEPIEIDGNSTANKSRAPFWHVTHFLAITESRLLMIIAIANMVMQKLKALLDPIQGVNH